MNQKNPPQVLRSEMRADSVPVDEHYSTEGYFYDNPILTRTGIFKYNLCAEVIRLNFSGFFKDASTLFGGLIKVRRAGSSNSMENSTTTE